MGQEDLKLHITKKLEKIIDQFDKNLKKHSIRVGFYAEKLANLMCLEKKEITEIKKGGVLHDIGKILINSNLLNKTTKLTVYESDKMKEHPVLGIMLLKNESKVVENIVLFHHEKWDGKGYPLGLKGKDIPIEARIVSLVDCYDALTSKRTYKEKLSHGEALNLIKNESGKSFEPDLVAMFERYEKDFENIQKKVISIY